MGRIVANVAAFVLIAASIGFNIWRYPTVWNMVGDTARLPKNAEAAKPAPDPKASAASQPDSSKAPTASIQTAPAETSDDTSYRTSDDTSYDSSYDPTHNGLRSPGEDSGLYDSYNYEETSDEDESSPGDEQSADADSIQDVTEPPKENKKKRKKPRKKPKRPAGGKSQEPSRENAASQDSTESPDKDSGDNDHDENDSQWKTSSDDADRESEATDEPCGSQADSSDYGGRDNQGLADQSNRPHSVHDDRQMAHADHGRIDIPRLPPERQTEEADLIRLPSIDHEAPVTEAGFPHQLPSGVAPIYPNTGME